MEGFLNPQEVLKELKLKNSLTVADFGSGSGGWVIPLAKILEEGKVYAIDILEEPLSALKAKLNLEKIFNVETIQANVEEDRGTRLSESSCDLVLMTNLLFECEDKKAVFQEAKRVLKPGGRILMVDWKKDNPFTKEIEKVSFDSLKKTAKDLGLKLEKEFPAGAYHYALIFVK